MGIDCLSYTGKEERKEGEVHEIGEERFGGMFGMEWRNEGEYIDSWCQI